MTSALPDILARIVQHKREELAQVLTMRATLERTAESRLGDRRDFAAALKQSRPAIIAEIKQASPSKGVLAMGDFDPASIARVYEAGGASALSVLTDERFFRGSLADLGAARSAVQLPVLRKDFTTNDIHVIQAAAHGADAILLIAAILTEHEMRALRELAEQYGMAALVEVHDEEELSRAVASGARIVGVNNRDLRNFEVRLETSLRLAEQIPSSCTRISESGITSKNDIAMLRAAGYDAFLIGETLMRADDPSRTLGELLA